MTPRDFLIIVFMVMGTQNIAVNAYNFPIITIGDVLHCVQVLCKLIPFEMVRTQCVKTLNFMALQTLEAVEHSKYKYLSS